jgi:hypothetical protein
MAEVDIPHSGDGAIAPPHYGRRSVENRLTHE